MKVAPAEVPTCVSVPCRLARQDQAKPPTLGVSAMLSVPSTGGSVAVQLLWVAPVHV